MKTETAAPAETAPALMTATTKSITLKASKRVAVFDPNFTTAAALSAQKAAGKATSDMPLYLMQAVVRFDGEAWTAGRIKQELPGRDYLQLVGELFGDDVGDADGDDTGN